MIWNIIETAKKGKTIILTTHSMEEADICCQRIGIMAHGVLRCLGPQLHLKQKYGSGFKISFLAQPDAKETASRFIESLLPPGWKKLDSFATTASYEFKPLDDDIARLFDKVEAGKKENGIDDWGLSQTTLDEVFVKIITDADAMQEETNM